MRLCKCGKRLLEPWNEGTCAWCGYGDVQPAVTPYGVKPGKLRRLPHNLGQIQAEGKRPDPHLDNVVRLDRLRDRWKVPRLYLVRSEDDMSFADLSSREREVIPLVASGMENREIAARLGVTKRAVEKHMTSILYKTGARNRVALAVGWVRHEQDAEVEAA